MDDLLLHKSQKKVRPYCVVYSAVRMLSSVFSDVLITTHTDCCAYWW